MADPNPFNPTAAPAQTMADAEAARCDADLTASVNLAPADVRKAGPVFDLPIALALQVTDEQIEGAALRNLLALGDLVVDGSIRHYFSITHLTQSRAFSSPLSARRYGCWAFERYHADRRDDDALNPIICGYSLSRGPL
jgi:hypothetical protein